MKGIFLTALLTFTISGCSPSNKQSQTSIQLPLGRSALQLDIASNDQLLVGDFFLLKSEEGYVSLQKANTRDEFKLWGISTKDYLDQLYGTATPEIEDIAAAKSALAGDVIQSKLIAHDRYFAVYQKEVDKRERIFFTDKQKPSLIYYILETEGKDALEIFYGEK
tara:strand:+ start:16048 stop:16542 length:495 start_codon:yes stop_codon:yes gene_type:complete